MSKMKFCKVRDVKSPNRGTVGSAGIDFFIPEDFESVTLKPGENILIPSGIKVNFKNKKYALIAFNKSGIATKRSLVVGSEVVDYDYEGEIHFDMHNIGTENQTLNAGDKIVQFILTKIDPCELVEVESSDILYKGKKSERGEGGFGSTGTR